MKTTMDNPRFRRGREVEGNLGKLIRAAREARMLTLKEVAEHLGVTAQWVGLVERGETFAFPVDRTVQLAELLALDPRELLIARAEALGEDHFLRFLKMTKEETKG